MLRNPLFFLSSNDTADSNNALARALSSGKWHYLFPRLTLNLLLVEKLQGS